MKMKLANICAGYADVYACDPYPRHVGHVYHADEITDEQGRTVAPAGWVPVTLHRESHANQPQFPRLLSRQSAAYALATNDSLLLDCGRALNQRVRVTWNFGGG